jgi:gluconokinase
MIVIIIGVSGSGKTTIGQQLAKELNWEFSDADSFHSKANIEKMSHGIPLNDADRAPWLQTIREAINQWLQENKNVVLACSALKASYRQTLLLDSERIRVVYLKGSYELFAKRLDGRKNHYMKQSMLQSQCDTLEEPKPEEAILVDASQTPEEIVQQVLQGGRLRG